MKPEPFLPKGMTTGKTLSQAMKVGNLLFISGQVAMDNQGAIVAKGDFKAQAEYVFKRIEQIAVAAGASMQHVAKTTTFLVNGADYPAFNEVRLKTFTSNPPASSTVIVKGLVLPDLLVEVEAVVLLP